MKIKLLLLLLAIGLSAQAQEYFADGYTFSYGVAKQDSLYSIVATVKSNCMVFLKDPINENPHLLRRAHRTQRHRHQQRQ